MATRGGSRSSSLFLSCMDQSELLLLHQLSPLSMTTPLLPAARDIKREQRSWITALSLKASQETFTVDEVDEPKDLKSCQDDRTPCETWTWCKNLRMLDWYWAVMNYDFIVKWEKSRCAGLMVGQLIEWGPPSVSMMSAGHQLQCAHHHVFVSLCGWAQKTLHN